VLKIRHYAKPQTVRQNIMNDALMLNKVFEIISFYDKARWSSISNYNLINFYQEKLSDDSKLLTHWLCYITDRQMAFQRIWEIGGFIFSELVDKIKKEKSIELLNPDNKSSFIKKRKDGGYEFRSRSKVNGNKILLSYGLKPYEQVNFASRYYPSDYFSIIYTLDILKHFDYSLTKYIVKQLYKHKDSSDYIKRLLFSLYLLTYYEIGQPTKTDLMNFENNLNKAKKRTEKILKLLNENFENEYHKFLKETIFKQKRAWCSLRDFFKSPEFNLFFKNSLESENVDLKFINQLFTLNSFQQFELPGDVWNNNSKFRNCILENTEYETSKKSLNIILREFFEKNKSKLINCYPEQFDITFDFVPRMCENNNCDICPIGLIKGKVNSNFKKTCVQNKNLYCSVALTNCNYKTDCIENKCDMIKYFA
jgi:hypothetical protein